MTIGTEPFVRARDAVAFPAALPPEGVPTLEALRPLVSSKELLHPRVIQSQLASV